MGHSQYDPAAQCRPAWNAGKTVGTKRPLTQKQIWAVRFFLDREGRLRDRALFDLAIDSKLRGCDLVKIKIGDLVSGADIRTRAIVIQQKTGKPVQFELTADVRASLLTWLERRGGTVHDYAFPSRVDHAALTDSAKPIEFALRRARASEMIEVFRELEISKLPSGMVESIAIIRSAVHAVNSRVDEVLNDDADRRHERRYRLFSAGRTLEVARREYDSLQSKFARWNRRAATPLSPKMIQFLQEAAQVSNSA